MSNLSRFTQNVNISPGQYSIANQSYNNQDGMKMIHSQENSQKYTTYCDKKIYVGDVALSEESPVTITQVCCNPFKPASSEDEIAIDGQKTRKPRTVINERWTNEEDARLAKAVKEHGAKNWKNIAKIVGGSRTDVQCLHRWRKVISPELVKGPWTSDEDRVIIEEVEKVPSLANVKWSEIAQRLHGRIGKQCRERYLNYLDRSIKHGEWTEEEDRVLFEIQRVIGNRWCEIAKVLPGRSENNVKNRYNSKMRNVYLMKNPNQMIPTSIIIEQQIEDPVHGNKKRRILCPAVKNLLKYLNLSREYFESLEEYNNLKNGNKNKMDEDISLSIQPSATASAALLYANNNNTKIDIVHGTIQISRGRGIDGSNNDNSNNNNNMMMMNSGTAVPGGSGGNPTQQLVLPLNLPCQKGVKRQYRGGEGDDISNSIINKRQKPNNGYYRFEDSFIYGYDEDDISTLKSTKSKGKSSKPKVTKQYQLRKRRKSKKSRSKYIEESEGEEEEEEEEYNNNNNNNIFEDDDDNIIENNRNNLNNNNNNVNGSSSSSVVVDDNGLLLSGYVDEEEAYKNFVETIDNHHHLLYTSTTTSTNTNIITNNNNRNTLNINTDDTSMTRFYNNIHNMSIGISSGNSNVNNNNNCIISNNFSDSIEDELNPSCLDCFE